MKIAHTNGQARLQKTIRDLQAKVRAEQRKAQALRKDFQAKLQSKRRVLKKNAAAAGRALRQLVKTAV